MITTLMLQKGKAGLTRSGKTDSLVRFFEVHLHSIYLLLSIGGTN